jgi:hypothetical protein
MKRRELLKQAAATAAVAGVATTVIAGEGCATVPRAPTAPHDDRAAANYLTLLDHNLGLVGTMRPVREMAAARQAGPQTAEQQQLVDTNDAMFQRLMRTLFITQSFRDLPPETQIHPAVQERIGSHLEEVDRTVFELTDFLAARTSRERADLRATLRKNPRVGMDVAEQLDGRAARLGVSKARRTQLRQIMKHATFRLRTESPGSLIDEYTEKVQRLRGEDGKSALALALAQKVGERQFWRYQQHLAQSTTPSSSLPATGAPGATPSLPPPGAAPASPTAAAPKPGSGAVTAGGYMLGIGIVDFGLGALIVSNTSGPLAAVALVGGITVGALLVAIGLVVLLVGAVIEATSP